MTEDEPTFLSDEESEEVSRILDRTPQIDRKEAIRRVIGNERAKRLSESEAEKEDATNKPATTSSRPAKPAYRARYQDSTDHSVTAFKQVTKGQVEVSEEEVEAGRESQAFISRVLEETGGFDLPKYLQSHPEKTEEARQLGLVE